MARPAFGAFCESIFFWSRVLLDACFRASSSTMSVVSKLNSASIFASGCHYSGSVKKYCQYF